jgi:23S rRNA pseudouridine2605 synthase
MKALHPVGRLDADTTGLLIFSKDGQFTQKLLNPRNEIEREYEALVKGLVDYEKLRLKLALGIQTSEGIILSSLIASRAFHKQSELEYMKSSLLESNIAPCIDTDLSQVGDFSYVRIVVTEGKYRMVRRILHNAGHSVICLHRSRYGGVSISAPFTGSNMTTFGELGKVSDIEIDKFWPPKVNMEIDTLRSFNKSELDWMKHLKY